MKYIFTRKISRKNKLLLFYIVITLLVILILFLLSRQNGDHGTSEQTLNIVDQQKQLIEERSPKVTTPKGWKEVDCTKDKRVTKVTQLFPNDDKAIDCNDKTNVTYVVFGVDNTSFECLPENQVKGLTKTRQLLSYACEYITLGHTIYVKETANYGSGPFIKYTTESKPATTITSYSKDDGQFPNIKEVEQLISDM